ncbi:MAG: membrane dipeptidase [Thermomicrobiales bacterium]
MAHNGQAAVAENKGFHPFLQEDHPYTFIDSCMQAWPDADYANAHRHGVTAYAVTAWRPHATIEQALEEGMFWRLVERQYDNVIVAETADDIRQAKADGKAALIITAQGGDWIGNKLHRIEAMQRLGLRMMLPAYNTTNLICDGALDRTEGGLTRFGELAVDECNRVGILLDCTHVGKKSTLEIIERGQKPCVFSHSNPNGVVPNPRNIDDDQIKACVEKAASSLAPWGPLVMKPGTTHWPTVDDFIEHVDYVAQLTGSTDHIGIGTDMSLGTYPDHDHDPWGEPSTRMSRRLQQVHHRQRAVTEARAERVLELHGSYPLCRSSDRAGLWRWRCSEDSGRELSSSLRGSLVA